ncbi:hypothetical protein ACTXT7_000227 [Hymenolepis weldensis]
MHCLRISNSHPAGDLQVACQSYQHMGASSTLHDENDNDPVFIRPAAETSDSGKASGSETFFEGDTFSPPPPSQGNLDSQSPSPSSGSASASAPIADKDRIPVVAVSRLPANGGSLDANSFNANPW